MEIKHPVSFLQELMAKHYKKLPVYQMADLSTNGGPSFRCTVEVDGVVGIGDATSKQAAKKDAAFNALNQLNYPTKQLYSQKSNNLAIASVANGCTTLSALINYNAIGKLNELTAQKQLPYPCYNEGGFNEDGHFLIKCRVLDYETQGCAPTKKSAKQLAAYSMLELLKKEKVLENIKISIPEIKNSLSDDEILHKFKKLTLKNFENVKIENLEENMHENKTDKKISIVNKQDLPPKELSQILTALKAIDITYTIDVISKNPYVLALKFQNEQNTTIVDSGNDYETAYRKILQRAVEQAASLEDLKKIS